LPACGIKLDDTMLGCENAVMSCRTSAVKYLLAGPTEQGEVTGMAKFPEYAALVSDRKACHRCTGLCNPSEVEQGSLDSNQIGPWTLWQGNLDATLMVVGQDWGDAGYFAKNRGRDLAQNFTNRALVELLAIAGIIVEPIGAAELSHVAFFTNAILCLKSGGLQGRISPAWFENCRRFLRRQIEIVHPRVVIGLGEHSYRSILESFALSSAPFRAEVETAGGRLLPNGTRALAVYHCGARIRNTHRSLDEQKQDWLRIRPHVRGAG
jgi:DNA polymerase